MRLFEEKDYQHYLELKKFESIYRLLKEMVNNIEENEQSYIMSVMAIEFFDELKDSLNNLTLDNYQDTLFDIFFNILRHRIYIEIIVEKDNPSFSEENLGRLYNAIAEQSEELSDIFFKSLDEDLSKVKLTNHIKSYLLESNHLEKIYNINSEKLDESKFFTAANEKMGFTDFICNSQSIPEKIKTFIHSDYYQNSPPLEKTCCIS